MTHATTSTRPPDTIQSKPASVRINPVAWGFGLCLGLVGAGLVFWAAVIPPGDGGFGQALLIGLGALLLLIAWRRILAPAHEALRTVRRGQRVTARILEIRSTLWHVLAPLFTGDLVHEPSSEYRVTIEFKCEKGDVLVVQRRLKFDGACCLPDVGEQMEVYVDLERPNRFLPVSLVEGLVLISRPHADAR